MQNKREFILPAVLLALLMGCSTQSRTVRTETVQEPVPAAYRTEGAVRTTESTETRTETQSESTGVLSGTLDIVGKTLALPFRVMGGLIDIVF